MKVFANRLRERQLEALQQRMPRTHGSYSIRRAADAEDSLDPIHRLLETTGIAPDRIDRCLRLAEDDPRFTFLDVVPFVAAFTEACSRALEKSLFDTTSNAAAEMGFLMNLFRTLLGGLMEEAPDVLKPDLPLLAEVMIEQEWAETFAVPTMPLRPNRHVLTAFLCELTMEIIRRTVTSHGWLSDRTVRRRFAMAARAAFIAEYASVRMTIRDAPSPDVRALGKHLRAKSTHWAVVTALAPICVRGCPADLDLRAYDAFARAVGVYKGWIDDIAGILVDLRRTCWSNVLLEVATNDPQWLDAYLQPSIPDRLPDKALIESLAATGVRLHDDVMDRLRYLPLKDEPIATVLADLTQSILKPNSAP